MPLIAPAAACNAPLEVLLPVRIPVAQLLRNDLVRRVNVVVDGIRFLADAASKQIVVVEDVLHVRDGGCPVAVRGLLLEVQYPAGSAPGEARPYALLGVDG